MKRETYKKHVIDARSSPLQVGGSNAYGWIEKHHGDGVTIKKDFFTPGVFSTEDEAVEAALAHGRRIIDGGFSS